MAENINNIEFSENEDGGGQRLAGFGADTTLSQARAAFAGMGGPVDTGVFGAQVDVGPRRENDGGPGPATVEGKPEAGVEKPGPGLSVNASYLDPRQSELSRDTDRGLPMGSEELTSRKSEAKRATADLCRTYGMRLDASDKELDAMLNSDNDFLSNPEQRERRFLGVRDDASQATVGAARQDIITDLNKRLQLPANASPEQIRARQEQLRQEAGKVFLGLDKNASQKDFEQALNDEMALRSDLPLDKRADYLGLSAQDRNNPEKVQQAMAEAERRQLERFKIDRNLPDYKEQLAAARAKAAGEAQRHSYGLRSHASDTDISRARQDTDYLSRRMSFHRPFNTSEAELDKLVKAMNEERGDLKEPPDR